MREAVIVSTARTPIGRAYRGAFNDTQAQALAGHVVAEAVRRAGVDPAEVEDVVLGAALQQGSSGYNIARQAAVRAGLPVSVAGMTIDRQCASGLMAIATAAKQIVHDGMTIAVGGGVEFDLAGPERQAQRVPGAGSLAGRAPARSLHDDDRDRRDRRRAIPGDPRGAGRIRPAVAAADRGGAGGGAPRPGDRAAAVDHARSKTARPARPPQCRSRSTRTRATGRRRRSLALAALKPVFRDGQTVKEGRFITAGNASQLSDGASASLLMEAKEAERRGLQPLGAYRGIAVAGCAPDEMGIGPVFAVPKLLQQHGLKVDDIGLWELNEAFAVQALYCRDRLGIDPERYNVDGGAIVDRPSLRDVGRAHGRPRADRGQAPRGALCRRHDVRRRRHGRGRAVRGACEAFLPREHYYSLATRLVRRINQKFQLH